MVLLDFDPAAALRAHRSGGGKKDGKEGGRRLLGEAIRGIFSYDGEIVGFSPTSHALIVAVPSTSYTCKL
ncbi:hypothetical protein E2562_026474 [Oryza meyeriana var. granulata]|uniref:Uncharacterized protein n=1 Tax=Oryza meyeriana var. granulata TaxID=110450 RepID=A0A6G1DN56_9ORYZ|nr:hypothetical protein E2562_026474 [Oryza meyeriana var. granulata]